MGHFTKETLEKFQQMCAAGLDFGEAPVYNFAMCIMPNGEVYGVSPGEDCKQGTPIADNRAAKLKQKPDVRMAMLKKAFMKKTGKEMSKEDLAKAVWLINKSK